MPQKVHSLQPAVSALIFQLEVSLAVRLFDRRTRNVQLAGPRPVFVEQARLLRDQLDEAVCAVRDVVQFHARQVMLAALPSLPSLAATVVLLAFARFSSTFPGVRLQGADTLSGSAFDLVCDGLVEFAFTAANLTYADLDYAPLAADGFALLLPALHALAQDTVPLRRANMADLTHIFTPLPSSVRQNADLALLAHCVRFAPRYEVEHLATINAMVTAGLGMAALPEWAAAVAPRSGLVPQRLVGSGMRLSIKWLTQSGRSISPASATGGKRATPHTRKSKVAGGGRCHIDPQQNFAD